MRTWFFVLHSFGMFGNLEPGSTKVEDCWKMWLKRV